MRRACTSRLASQVPMKRTGAGVSGSGSGARGRSISSWPSAERNRRSARRPRVGASSAGGRPVNDATSLAVAGPKRAEVAADEVLGCVGGA